MPPQWRMPAEWHEQEWLWIGFPHDAREWPGTLAQAQEEIAAFANAVADTGQQVRLLVRDAANEARARTLTSAAVRLERRVYGDIWLRDTGPLVVTDGDGGREARRFAFNGWGGKFQMAGDRTVGAELAREAGLALKTGEYVLEGGALDGDGTGLCVTTEQCLLNTNRNPCLDRAEVERLLARDLGLSRVIWLGEGLAGDHTDGHVDNLARFVAPGRIALPLASSPDDPNCAVYADARERAGAKGLSVVDVPSPGALEMGPEIEPASYLNFVIANYCVIVPQFGVAQDKAACEAIDALFPDRRAVGLPARAVLSGGGSFHCASQQMPAA